MKRPLFCHEQAMLSSFNESSPDVKFTWAREVCLEDIAEEEATGREQIVFNSDFRLRFQPTLPENHISRLFQIHPQVLTPAIFLVAEATTHELFSLEQLFGSELTPNDYRDAAEVIDQVLAGISGHAQPGEPTTLDDFRWVRIVVALGKIFFLLFREEYYSYRAAEHVELASRGDDFAVRGFRRAGTFVGLDGWIACDTTPNEWVRLPDV